MKYYTKRWYKDTQKKNTELSKEPLAYEEYLNSIKLLLPEDLFGTWILHDNLLIGMEYKGTDCYMHFNPIKSMSDIKELILKDVKIIENEITLVGRVYCFYNEIYLIPEGYEMHFLFCNYKDDGIHESELQYFTAQISDVDFKIQFRNIGKCIYCERIVSDPKKINYNSHFAKTKGKFINNKWVCEYCFETLLKGPIQKNDL